MMAFFNLTRKSKILMAFILVLTLVTTYAVPMSVYAITSPTQTTTKDFKVNLFNYEMNNMNTANGYYRWKWSQCYSFW